MTARKNILAGFALVAVVVGVVASQMFRPRIPDPIYEGRHLSFWVARYGTEWEKPNAAVRQAGTNAIPLLLQLLRTHDSQLKHKLIELGAMQDYVQWPFVSHARRYYYRALCGFEALGTNGQEAVSRLLQICEVDPSGESHPYTLDALAAIGTGSREFVSWLHSAATNSIPELRKYAIDTLGSMRAEPETTIPLLLGCLNDPDSDIQRVAVESLGRFGPQAESAVPQLLELRKTMPPAPDVPDGRFLSREMIDDALLKIDPAAAASAGIAVTNASASNEVK
jgi:HEAT repeat protein